MSNYNKILSQDDGTISLQVTHLENIKEGFTGDFNRLSLIKNISDNNINVELKMGNKYINTIIYPGWNPELVIGIKNAPANLQLGY